MLDEFWLEQCTIRPKFGPPQTSEIRQQFGVASRERPRLPQ